MYRLKWQEMKRSISNISSVEIKEKGRTAYYKMLESMRQGEFVQVRQELYANIDQITAGMIDIETFILGDIL